MKCPDCDKEFETEGPLNQHRIAKHDFKIPIEKKPINYKRISLWGAVILVILIIIYLIFKPSGYVPLPYMENSIGSKDASVTVIEFSDFECPACKSFWSNVEPQLKEELVDTGKVRFVYKHFPLPQHKYAFKSAEASECAADQGKFWEYHDRLFTESLLDVKNLKRYAQELGLDTEKFDKCLKSGVMRSRINDDLSYGAVSKVQATPSFLINGKLMSGFKPFEQFKEIIGKEIN